MARYAHIKDGAVYRIAELTPEQVADIPPHKAQYILPVVDVERPTYDPETHKAPTRNTTITATEVTRGWNAPVALTAEEIDEEKDRQLSRVERVLLEGLFNHENRIRTLEGKNAITLAQFRDALKALL